MKKILCLGILLACMIGLHAQNQQVLDEALKLKNSLDAYMKQQVGNTPLTDKEKWMFKQLDSLQKSNAELKVLLKNCGQNNQPVQPIVQQQSMPISIFFTSGSSVLDAKSKIQLELLLKQLNNKDIKIQAFTDAYGTQKYNEKLASARLESISKYLTSLGYTGKIETLAYTFDSQASGQKSSFSRRVDIIF